MNIAISTLELKKEQLLNAGRYRNNRIKENQDYYKEELTKLDEAIEILRQANGAEQSSSNCNIPLVSDCTCPMESTNIYDDEQNYLGYICKGCGYFSKY